MNSYQKHFKVVGSFMILGTVTTNNCESLVVPNLLPNGSCPVLVPGNCVMVAEEMHVMCHFHIAPDLLAGQVFAGRKAA